MITGGDSCSVCDGGQDEVNLAISKGFDDHLLNPDQALFVLSTLIMISFKPHNHPVSEILLLSSP